MSLAEYAELLRVLAAALAPSTNAAQARGTVEALSQAPTRNELIGASIALGRALMLGGQFNPAERLFATAATTFPKHPVGPVGLAFLATRHGTPAEALRRWEEAFSRFPDHVKPDWRIARDRVAMRARLASGHAADVPASATAPEAAVQHAAPAVSAPAPSGGAAFAMLVQHMDGLARADRMGDVRALYPQALASAQGPGQLRKLLLMLPPAFEGHARAEAVAQFQAKLDAQVAAEGAEAAGRRTLDAVRLRLCLLTRDYAGFVERWPRYAAGGPPPPEDAMLPPIAAKLAARNFPDYGAEKIFCIGLSKTGTTSMTAALQMLGYSALHWANPATNALMHEDDFLLFDAFADLPTCEAFERTYYLFPNSRFIYTTRPLQSWKRSYEAQMQGAGEGAFAARRTRMLRDGADTAWGSANARIALGLFYNHPDIVAAYKAYHGRVHRFFADKPASRFLVFDLASGHGFPELCAFTGRPDPGAPYPQKNVLASAR